VTTKKTPSIRVVLKLPTKVADLLVFAQKVHDQMAANSGTLPNPDPALPKLQTDVDNLSSKESLAKTRAEGAVADRDAAREVVEDDLRSERAYVEKTCNASPANAASIAQDAGMTLRQLPTLAKPPLAAKRGTVSGAVHVVAKAAKGASANAWQVSTDGGKTWVDLPVTTRASTEVQSLTVGATVSFRHRALTKAGWGDWSDPVASTVT
jgi:hypothetical protein